MINSSRALRAKIKMMKTAIIVRLRYSEIGISTIGKVFQENADLGKRALNDWNER